MIYWTKLLVTAFGIINTIDSFIPFYLINQLQLPTIQVSLLISLLYLFRLLSGFWSSLVDQRPHLYSVIISLLTTFSSFSYIILLSLACPFYHQLSSAWIWCLLITCYLLNGVFYQPLGPLINSAIIKILGDYRVLFYGSYIRWNKITTIITTGLIGLVMNALTKDRYFDIVLFSTFLIGMVLLFIIALFFITVEPAHASQLDISEEQAPLLLKNALHLTGDHLQYPIYRPYSIFGEQLSHISEEEASQLDRVFTTDDSLRLVESMDSNTPSFYSRNSNGFLYPSFSRQTNDQQQNSTTFVPTIPYNILALSPLPIPTDALIAFYSQYIKTDQDVLEENNDFQYTPQYMPKINVWKSRSLSITLFLLGISQSLLNTFLFIYFYSILEISIYMISCLIMVHMISELSVSYMIEKWFIHAKNLTLVTTCVHITLILCVIVYPCLKPNIISTQIALIILQALQACAFQLLWLCGIDQVNAIYWNQSDRIQQRSKLAAFYSSVGPAIGTLVAGVMLRSDFEDYTLIYKSCVAIFSFSFVVSWGWTSDD